MASIDKQIEQLNDRVKLLKAKRTRQERKDDIRRKILHGAAVLKLLEEHKGPKVDHLKETLSKHITRESDREFLGLGPIKEDQKQRATGNGTNG